MRTIVTVLLFASVTLVHADWVGVTWTAELLTINPDTGAASIIGTGPSDMNSLAKNSAGEFFVNSGTNLYKIDFSLSKSTHVCSLDFGAKRESIRGLAFDSNDVLYAVNGDLVGGIHQPFDLFKIDTTTGNETFIGNTGYIGIQSLDFSPSGILFGWLIGKGLVAINTANASTSIINPGINDNVNIQSICFSPDGSLYGIGNNLYSINTTNSSYTLVGPAGISDIRGLEYSTIQYQPPVRPKALLPMIDLLLNK